MTAKIIDLGLAKAVDEAPSQTAISMPGAFAGTPEFASPEQFAGVHVDIRSDLYSLGVTLWEMLTGQTAVPGFPSRGDVSTSACALTARATRKVPAAGRCSTSRCFSRKTLERRFQNPAESPEGAA